jgi:hypothetical protein
LKDKGNIASGTMMTAREIGTDGVFRKYGIELPLLGADMPVPPHLRRDKTQDTEKVLFILEASLYVKYCNACKASIKKDAIILVMETIRLIPAHCCDTLLWFDEDEYEKGEGEHGMETYE